MKLVILSFAGQKKKKNKKFTCTCTLIASQLLIMTDSHFALQLHVYREILKDLSVEIWEGQSYTCELKNSMLHYFFVTGRYPHSQHCFCGFGLSITSKNVFKPKKMNADAFLP